MLSTDKESKFRNIRDRCSFKNDRHKVTSVFLSLLLSLSGSLYSFRTSSGTLAHIMDFFKEVLKKGLTRLVLLKSEGVRVSLSKREIS